MRFIAVSALVGLLAAAAPADAADDTLQACSASPKRVGDCFTVHGRATACTGIPNVRIWIVGTKRILGVADASGSVAGDILLPGRLNEDMFDGTPCSKAAFGDFTVCPLEPSRPGVMQRVCVVSAAKIRMKDDW